MQSTLVRLECRRARAAVLPAIARNMGSAYPICIAAHGGIRLASGKINLKCLRHNYFCMLTNPLKDRSCICLAHVFPRHHGLASSDSGGASGQSDSSRENSLHPLAPFSASTPISGPRDLTLHRDLGTSAWLTNGICDEFCKSANLIGTFANEALSDLLLDTDTAWLCESSCSDISPHTSQQ